MGLVGDWVCGVVYPPRQNLRIGKPILIRVLEELTFILRLFFFFFIYFVIYLSDLCRHEMCKTISSIAPLLYGAPQDAP